MSDLTTRTGRQAAAGDLRAAAALIERIACGCDPDVARRFNAHARRVRGVARAIERTGPGKGKGSTS